MAKLVKHKFLDTSKTEYDIGAATNYSLKTPNRIIVNESATGYGATTIFNGQHVKDIPLNGRLFGTTFDDCETKRLKLQKLADSGEVIEFISPYIPTASNKFFIRDLTWEPANGSSNSIAFSCSLVEFRQANVKTIQVNLVNYASRQAFMDAYTTRLNIGQ